jgi:very-short-patch-repair endonuclease
MTKIFSKKPMTENELSFYNILKSSFPNLIILGQVAIPAIVSTNNIKTRNYFRHYYIDFAICDNEGNIILIIELDDKTHKDEKRIERDKKINTILHLAQIPFIRINSQKKYNDEFVKNEIENYITRKKKLPNYEIDNEYINNSRNLNYYMEKDNNKKSNEMLIMLCLITLLIITIIYFFLK